MTTPELVAALDALSEQAEATHPEVAGILLACSGLLLRPNPGELRGLFLGACSISARELEAIKRDEVPN